MQWVWACIFKKFGAFLDFDKDVVGLIHESDVESKQVLQDIANQYKQNKHFTVKSNVLGLDNEESRIRLGIERTKSGETTTLEKNRLTRIKPILNSKKKIIHR